jgi:RNA chaperone Hfq
MENDELRRSFIADCISKKRNVRVHLVGGIKLQGTITKQDSVSIRLERTGFEPQLVNHHGVGTIQPIEEENRR